MIFKPDLCRKILAGAKTQTRRPIKDDESICRYKPGRSYALQPGRGKPGSARIEILAVEQQTLGEITFEEARAEGFKTRDDFFAYWAELYGHCDREQLVWAIAFRLLQDTPRLLHRDSSRGYTSDPRLALVEEPEAISERDQLQITADARNADKARRLEVWSEEKEKIEASIERLKGAGIDVADVRVIKLRVHALDRKIAKEVAA